jgi:uncharacterized LabA/DUF88 family protein
MPRPRAIAYIDGFKLYYRALRKTSHKWLNLSLLLADLFPSHEIGQIRYYTARVSGRKDPDEPKRQHLYLRALETIPHLSIHYGRFLPKIITRPLVHPIAGLPEYVEVHSTEEKGSDVNLASHLIHDGCAGKYDEAIVVTKDTDLTEPIRIVTRELGLPVGLACPDGEVPKAVASFVRHITPARLGAAQFPHTVVDSRGREIHCPSQWRA